jgi:hypothetical protein
MEDRENVLGTGLGLDGLKRLGKAHRQKAARMEGLTPEGVVETQIPRDRVHLPLRPCPDTVDGALDRFEHGQPITRIARMALRHQMGQDTTGCWFRCDAGLSAKRRGTMALALEHGGKGAIVGIDPCTVAPLLAVGQPCGLVTDVFMVAHRRGEGQGETVTLGLTQGERLFEALVGLEGQDFDRLAACQTLLCRMSHQLANDRPVAATASAKTPHDLCECLCEASGLALECGGPVTALRDEVVDERSRFFCAVDSVVASVTR